MMIPRIDAHHHTWDAATGCYPWLESLSGKRFWGDPALLVRRYRMVDYLAAAIPAGFVASVHVEAAFSPPSREASAMQDVIDAGRFPQVFLTAIDLSHSQAGDRIRADAAHPNFRGVRISANWDPDPARSSCTDPQLLANPAWRRNYGGLSGSRCVADLLVWPRQLLLAADLAETFPQIPVVIEHCGLPNDSADWDAGMVALSALPNVAIKISGLAMIDPGWTAGSIRPMLYRILDLFGCDRTMFGSNAPIDLLHTSFAQIVGALDAAIDGLTETVRRAIWHDTAARVYRIPGASL